MTSVCYDWQPCSYDQLIFPASMLGMGVVAVILLDAAFKRWNVKVPSGFQDFFCLAVVPVAFLPFLVMLWPWYVVPWALMVTPLWLRWDASVAWLNAEPEDEGEPK